jgi:hypothetical protein
VNLAKGEKPTMSDATRDYLREYYREEAARLKELLGQEPPWRREKPLAEPAKASVPA